MTTRPSRDLDAAMGCVAGVVMGLLCWVALFLALGTAAGLLE